MRSARGGRRRRLPAACGADVEGWLARMCRAMEKEAQSRAAKERIDMARRMLIGDFKNIKGAEIVREGC